MCKILNVCFVMNGTKIGFYMSIKMSVILFSRWSNFDIILIRRLISYQIISITAQADTLQVKLLKGVVERICPQFSDISA